jgi:Flp pilus assembly protein TadD
MGAIRHAGAVVAAWAAACVLAGAASYSPHPPYSPQSESRHHVQVAEEAPPPPGLANAEDFIQKRDYAAAEPLLRKVVEADPTNYVAWFDLGFTENGLGKMDDSIAAYRKSVEAKPDVFESNLNLGLQLANAGNPDAAAFLRAATHLKPTSNVAEGQERAWLSLGHVIETDKPKEAVEAYRHAAELQPKDTEPHLSAGLLFEQQNKFADAEQEYKQALALDASSLDAATGLANLYMRGRRFPEAETELRKIAAAHPENPAAHMQLGRVLAAEGKNEDAITELEAAKLAPGDTSLQLDLAELYTKAGRFVQAEVVYRGLAAAHPEDAGLHHRLAQTLIREEKFSDAQQELQTTVKLKPEMVEAYSDLAFVGSETKNYPLVLQALDARVKYAAETAPTYFLRATAYDHLQQVKPAIANYHLFLQAANGKYPDQEWQAQHRLVTLEHKK